jgi:hypothetical protein
MKNKHTKDITDPAFPVPFGFVSDHKNTGPNDPIPDSPFINTANGISERMYLIAHAPSLPVIIAHAITKHCQTEYGFPEWNGAWLTFFANQERRWREAYADTILKGRALDFKEQPG